MTGDWPSTDSRRADRLRDEIAGSAAMLAPDWAGLHHQGDFGRALVEIAARLAEHSSSRLDRTALRDKLAFLSALDIASPPPRSATVPIVFTLAEKRETPVFAPARVKLSARGDPEDVDFETREAIDLTPARLSSLIVADPMADRVESAPSFVTSGLAEAAPATIYRLLGAVEAGATALQLVQAVGIKPQDLLRLGGVAYRVEKVDGSIVQLIDPLAGSSPAGAAVEKLIALESFELRNLQEHAAYFGHKEMLKLDGPAEITLVFDPPTLPSRLAGLDVEYRLWGTRANESDAGWQPLDLVGAGRRGLRLAKGWEGSVDEREIGGCASRWVRLRLKTPIAGACGPPTSTVSVALKVESAAVQDDKSEGSETIAAAFYNGQPLPTSTAFFPFGPEPQRFDIFALSAPEALSKKGARVTLTLGLDDASLHAMAYAEGDPDHVYGVSANGRLQSVRFAPSKPADWRQLGLASVDSAAGVGAGAGTVRLDDKSPIYALNVGDRQDLVFVRGSDDLVRWARIETAGAGWSVGEWRNLPPVDDKAFLSFCLIPAAEEQSRIDGVAARLVAVAADALYVRTIAVGGAVALAWTRVESNLALSEPVTISVALRGAGAVGATLVLVDSEGRIHRGEYHFALNLAVWTRLSPSGGATATTAPSKANPAVRPVAWLEGSSMMVVAARNLKDQPQADPLLILDQQLGELESPRTDLRARLGSPRSILAQAWTADDSPDQPLIVVTGTSGILLWAPGQDEVVDLPADAGPDFPYGLLLPGADQSNPPALLLNAGRELILHQQILIGTEEVEVDLHDVVWRVEGDPVPTHLVFGAGPPRPLPGPWLTNDVEAAHMAPASLDPGDNYLPVLDMAAQFSGASRDPSDDRKMTLVASDAVTRGGDFLEIEGHVFRITALDDATKVATVHADLPSGSFAYKVYRRTEPPRTMTAGDRLRLAELDSPAPLGADEMIFPSPAIPRRQPIVDSVDEWLLLGREWDEDPQGDEALVTSELRLDSATPIRLPRLGDNPDLSWEYYDGDGWRRLDDRAERAFLDGTLNLAKSGAISFQVPDDLCPTEIGGKEDYWIRARLVGGDYGRPAYLIASENAPPAPLTSRTSITVDRSKLNPPEIVSIEASYVLDVAVPPDCVVAENNLAAIDQTQAALEDGALFNLFEGVAQHVGDSDGGTRALYLGFSRRPAVPALNLYADSVDTDAPKRDLIAEVMTRDGWREIGADDETSALTRPGMVRLYLQPQPEQLPLFGRDGWWLRLRPGQDAADWAPVIRGLFVNAVVAEHAKSVEQELLGSSLGDPDQSYRLAQVPVLPATLELRVRESLGREEREALDKAGGADAVRDEDPNLPGQWVLWSPVDSFVDQDGDSRVYRLDPTTGEVRFGNGRCGKVPPAGADSIRAFSYQKGGGSVGNVGARTIDKLSSAIESVEQAINPVDSAGGADAPRAERVAVTAPALLRHSGRALAPADIESLVVESSPDIVRARCLERKGCGITLAVAIRSAGIRCPVPTRARREGIARNIAAAGWGALAPEAVVVKPPRYVHVRLEVEVLATRADAVAGVDHSVREALAAFLHPLEGGPDGLGWPFGRRIWPSDVQRAIAGIEGLDRVVALDIAARDPGDSLDSMPPDGLVCVEERDIGLVVRPPEDGR